MKLKLPVYSIGLFDNSKIATSTPILNTEMVLPKQTNFQYYTRLYDGGLIRYDNYSDFTTFQKERNKLLKRVNYQPHYLEAPYSINGDIYTSTNETVYDNIVLRSKKSYDSLSDFVMGFTKFIQNAEIKNGLNSINLSEIGVFSNNYRQENERKDYLLGTEKNIYLPISFYQFQVIRVKFLSDFRNSDCETLGMPNLYWTRTSNPQLQYSMDYGKNSTWEDKMLVMQGTRNGYEWVSYKQYTLNSHNNTSFKLKATYPYFDFVFASYVKYLYDFQILKSKSGEVEDSKNWQSSMGKSRKLQGFPLQLTLIGNDQDVVLKIEVNNIVTLDEISKVQKYTIQRVK